MTKVHPVPPNHIPNVRGCEEPTLPCEKAPSPSDVPTTFVCHPTEDVSHKLSRLSVPSIRGDIAAESHDIITDGVKGSFSRKVPKNVVHLILQILDGVITVRVVEFDAAATVSGIITLSTLPLIEGTGVRDSRLCNGWPGSMFFDVGHTLVDLFTLSVDVRLVDAVRGTLRYFEGVGKVDEDQAG